MDWCSKAHFHYNRSYSRGARAADCRLALTFDGASLAGLKVSCMEYGVDVENCLMKILDCVTFL